MLKDFTPLSLLSIVLLIPKHINMLESLILKSSSLNSTFPYYCPLHLFVILKNRAYLPFLSRSYLYLNPMQFSLFHHSSDPALTNVTND